VKLCREVRGLLLDQLSEPPEMGLVEAIESGRRLAPILGHVYELSPAARQWLLAGLPPGAGDGDQSQRG